MAGLLEGIEGELAERRPYQVCSVRRIIDGLDATDASRLEAILDGSEHPSTAIAEALRRRGIDVAAQTLNRHRKGRCGCARG